MAKDVPIEAKNQNGTVKYLPILKWASKDNRRNPTETEKTFWNEVLKNDKLGYRFVRQKPIGRFILDFYCSKLLLAIEIDGDSHLTKTSYDQQRDTYLLNRRIITFRYSVYEVNNHLKELIINLKQIVRDREFELKIA